MITMVKLNGTEGKYNYTLVVNEIAYDISINKDHENFEVKIDDALNSKKVTIFSKDVCILCDETKLLLNNNRINFEEFNIDKDSTQLIKLIKEYKQNKVDERTYAPILKIEDSLYTNLKTKQELIDALKNHF
jgi:glutaredoxin